MSLPNETSSKVPANPQDAANLAKLTPDVVKKLTEKLSKLMGQDLTGGFEQGRNERGEFLNEEGLPIIEISEPVDDTKAPEKMETFIEESPLPDLTSLPEPVRESLRKQRERLLDQLEEEERLLERHEELTDIEHRQEILRNRKEAAAKEKEKLKATKEMQKKLGKVLLQNLAKERAEEEEARAADAIFDDSKRSSRGDKGKKTVTFADPSDDERVLDDLPQTVDWGDITPARLRSGGPSLLSSSENLPLRKTVVERFPTAPPRSTQLLEPDSDDDSDPEPLLDENEKSDSEATLEEEFDVDFAQHQREIALQYHEKRDKIGAAAWAALTAHSHNGDDIRMDSSLDIPWSEPEKTSISQFKATRLASSYAATSPSTSLGASVIPASTARTIQKAVRTGKLDADDRLVGEDADSASEDETEGAQELLELLRRGEVYNIGPDGNHVHAISPFTGRDEPAAAPAPPSIKKPILDNLPPIDRPKVSKFKLSRAIGRPSQTIPSDLSSRNDTSVSLVERSPPKMASPLSASVIEKPPPKLTHAMNSTVAERTISKSASVITPMVSERRPVALANTAIPSATLPSMIVDSPSLPSSVSAPTQVSSAVGVTPFSMVVESPSFGKPTGLPRTQSRPLRPPVVMPSSSVREISIASSGDPNVTQTKTAKLSRFMAERS